MLGLRMLRKPAEAALESNGWSQAGKLELWTAAAALESNGWSQAGMLGLRKPP
jgi:predicted RNA binding protein YcfA (HicA-like mRNA interferase family)